LSTLGVPAANRLSGIYHREYAKVTLTRELQAYRGQFSLRISMIVKAIPDNVLPSDTIYPGFALEPRNGEHRGGMKSSLEIGPSPLLPNRKGPRSRLARRSAIATSRARARGPTINYED